MGFRETNSKSRDEGFSGWRFEQIISMTIYFYKTQEVNGGTSYVKKTS